MHSSSPHSPSTEGVPTHEEYFLGQQGQRTGPYSLDQLQEMLGRGQILEGDLLWQQGMTNWEPALKVLSGMKTAATSPAAPASQPWHPAQQPPAYLLASSAAQRTAKPVTWRILILPLGLALFCTVMVMAALLFSPRSFVQSVRDGGAADPAMLVGFGMGLLLMAGILSASLALLIGGVAKMAGASFRRITCVAVSISLPIVTLALLALFGFMVSLNSAKSDRSAKDGQADQAALEGMREDLAKIRQISDDPDRLGAEDQKVAPQKTASDLQTLIEKIRHMSQAFIQDVMVLEKDYQSELETLEVDRLFNTHRLEADTDFTESDQIMTRAADCVQRFQERAISLFEAYPSRLGNYTLSLAERASLTRQLNADMPRYMAKVKKRWMLEKQMLEEIGHAVKFLKTRRGHWKVGDDGAIQFDQETDLKMYQGFFALVASYDKQLRDMREQSLNEAEKKIDTAEEFLQR